jgi:hypothetical protein
MTWAEVAVYGGVVTSTAAAAFAAVTRYFDWW